ncbi:hypothetical protein H2200_001466 [Cladophialophora chaetospira]|uniref:Uncharacterized protein n=1 Tax=Cladophialophora chaetospira TaxID=386627 RepID=A0AA38XL15_9EURO|nr:hypothetical protein H2200_001466 [Cladophialophora chaetospira]
MEETSNVASFWKVQYEEAYRLIGLQRFFEADQICLQLLREPRLPLLYRAGCNRLFGMGSDNPVDCAEEAVRLYQFMITKFLEEAKQILKDAKQRVAEADNAASSDDSDGEQRECQTIEPESNPVAESDNEPTLQTEFAEEESQQKRVAEDKS